MYTCWEHQYHFKLTESWIVFHLTVSWFLTSDTKCPCAVSNSDIFLMPMIEESATVLAKSLLPKSPWTEVSSSLLVWCGLIHVPQTVFSWIIVINGHVSTCHVVTVWPPHHHHPTWWGSGWCFKLLGLSFTRRLSWGLSCLCFFTMAFSRGL